MSAVKLIVLLYSADSSACKSLFTFLNTYSEFDFIEKVCIDHPDIRKRVKDQARLPVHVVPCLLFSYEDGSLTKLEGEKLADWLKDFLVTSKNMKGEGTVRDSQVQSQAQRVNLTQQSIPEKRVRFADTPDQTRPQNQMQAPMPSKDPRGGTILVDNVPEDSDELGNFDTLNDSEDDLGYGMSGVTNGGPSGGIDLPDHPIPVLDKNKHMDEERQRKREKIAAYEAELSKKQKANTEMQ